MLIPHTFDKDTHIYKVPGAFVLSTSSVLEMNGLRLMHGVPAETLAWASERGTKVHEAIHALSEGRLRPRLTDEQQYLFGAYQRWQTETGFRVCGPCERGVVYQHGGTGQLIGATPDLIGMIGEDVYVVDIKTCHRQSGKAREQKHLEWRLQTQSYLEALQEDDDFIRALRKRCTKRMVLHLHPDCGIVERGGPRLGYEAWVFHRDDADIWDAAVRMACVKLACGHKLPEKPKALPEDRRQVKLAVYPSSSGPLEEWEKEIEVLF